jgi:hypothetical protein
LPTKSIETLVTDINAIFTTDIYTQLSTDLEHSDFGHRLANTIRSKLSDRDNGRRYDTPSYTEASGIRGGLSTTEGKLHTASSANRTSLRLSSLGTPCERKLWYSTNTPDAGEALSASSKIKFLYGDILEELLLFLAEEAGHDVQGRQTELDISGVKGHRDCVIDGRLVDVKSASSYSFKKFKEHRLGDDDPFGYLSQLGSYLYASRDDELVKDKDVASFLVIDKTLGHICLDTYPFDDRDWDRIVQNKRRMLSYPEPPARHYSDIPDGKSGNRKLDIACSYCSFKDTCWPSLRTFMYSYGPSFFTHVAREPRVSEAPHNV